MISFPRIYRKRQHQHIKVHLAFYFPSPPTLCMPSARITCEGTAWLLQSATELPSLPSSFPHSEQNKTKTHIISQKDLTHLTDGLKRILISSIFSFA